VAVKGMGEVVSIAESQTKASGRAFVDGRWRLLHKIAGAAALTSAVVIPIQIAVFVVWPPPLDGTAVDWFALFRDNRFAALVEMDLLLVVDSVLLIPILLSLYVLLRQQNETIMAIATGLGLFGSVLVIVSDPVIQMLSLADRYAAATTEVQRSGLVAASEAMLATWQGTGFHAFYILGSVAGIAIGAMMIRSTVFSSAAGWMAVLGNALGLGLYVPTVGVYISVFSVLFLEVWYILIGRRFLQLGTGSSVQEAAR
jgi:hypothetical protein